MQWWQPNGLQYCNQQSEIQTQNNHFMLRVVLLFAICVLCVLPAAHSAESTPNKAVSYSSNQAVQPIQISLEQHLQSGRLPQLGITLPNAASLYELYRPYGFEPLWQPLYRAHNPLQDLLAYLQQIQLHGLLARDYHYQTLQQQCQLPAAELVAEIAAECDLLQSDAILSLTQHLLVGKVDPELLFEKTLLEKPLLDLSHWFQMALNSKTLSHYFAKIEPKSQDYHLLKDYLALLSSLSAPEWQPLALKPSIKPQMSDPRLALIIERLVFWGDLSADWMHQAPYALVYKGELVIAVETFQLRHGLEADGVLGKNTIAALNVSPQQRVEQLLVNLERIRWYAHKPVGRLIKVNIPSFELTAYEDGKVSLKKAVIVGQTERQSPIFEDRIQYLVMNPTWIVPWKLATRDKLPLIQEDPQYLVENGFSVYQNGEKLTSPTQIDWNQVSKYQFPYRLIQAPGRKNALGQVKFMFPNPYEVYLHDTPAKSLFKKDLRAFSSGCIRVQEPMELVWWLLRSDGLSDIDIKKQLNKKYTNTVYLASQVPVRLEYRTAFLADDQSIQFRADIYQRDSKLYQALQQPVTSHLLH
ncbi:MAG: L,D-transpeptidase family protein [Gammaproteobacteria bacterium]|nr:L,D-transpeptidase family protein [Gammaproteobacteria bacterium]